MKQPDQGNEGQNLYDIFVAQGVKMVHGLEGKLKGNASIYDLGNALFYIVRAIETEGAENGIRFPLSVLLHGSNEILGHLIDVSQVKITEGQLKAVVGVAVGRYVENVAPAGRMTRGQIGQFAQHAQGDIGEQFGRSFQVH
jgi:hypothetical protein